jgi:hypothetical protein
VNEAWISLHGETSAARLMFKSLTARRAVGLGQLCLTVEAASRKETNLDARPSETHSHNKPVR